MSSRRSQDQSRWPPSSVAPSDDAQSMATTHSQSTIQSFPLPQRSTSSISGGASEGVGSSQGSQVRPSLRDQPNAISTAGSRSTSNLQLSTPQTSYRSSRRSPGVAPLSNLLHQGSSSPTYSSPATSPQDRMQTSPDTILAPEPTSLRPSELPFDPTRGDLTRSGQSLSASKHGCVCFDQQLSVMTDGQ